MEISEYQKFIHLSRYARWLETEKRRETWEETVKRYFDFMVEHLKETCDYTVSTEERNELEQAVLNMEIMPSMRALMSAGTALKRDNVMAYNCAYIPVDKLTSFDEILYILMSGTGVGFSVERKFINKLPFISEDFEDMDYTIQVADSKLGWVKAFRKLLQNLINGQIPKIDYSKIRPMGAKLKTFGGRAAGPDALRNLFLYTIRLFRESAGRQLTTIECHDLVCRIAEVVVVGGVRRAACISLSDLGDDRMREAKSGQWYNFNPERAYANNSVAYSSKPDIGTFMKEWLALYQSKSGERGIFNRQSANKLISESRRQEGYQWGVNPCGEIILRPRGFCNLTENVVRPNDTFEDIKRKVRLTSILGTWQSTLTDFKYISKKWKENSEEERLLGVSLTGIMDNGWMNGTKEVDLLPQRLNDLRDYVVEVNKEYSKKLGIQQSVATTTIKPSGNISQLVDCSSGIHTRHSPYYIRTVRADKKDPLCQFMIDAGFQWEDDVVQPNVNAVFSFPVKCPEDSVFRNDLSALDQLKIWMTYKQHWCEHNASVTINIKEHEWFEVGAWVYKNFNDIVGASFLPYSDHCYVQAPYQECDEKMYLELLEKTPKNVDWSKISEYEKEDNTRGSQTFACTGGSCEIVDLV